MIETPSAVSSEARLSHSSPALYPAENLSRFSFHTGAQLRPLSGDELCPVLFRDLGPLAMAVFLRGRLERLAGPLSPLTYMRTSLYLERYIDYERFGRLVFLRPLALHPWHSGMANVYVARATRTAPAETIGFVPGNADFNRISHDLACMRDTYQLRELFGGKLYDDITACELHRLEAFAAQLREVEELAAPLRHQLKSQDKQSSQHARDTMQRLGLDENDLCAAWHHIPKARRMVVHEALRSVKHII